VTTFAGIVGGTAKLATLTTAPRVRPKFQIGVVTASTQTSRNPVTLGGGRNLHSLVRNQLQRLAGNNVARTPDRQFRWREHVRRSSDSLRQKDPPIDAHQGKYHGHHADV